MPSRSPVKTSERAAEMAGASPKRTPVSRLSPIAKITIRRSIATAAVRVRSRGANARRPATPARATPRPSNPPAAPSTRLSVIIWRTTRHRPAPIAERTASSRRRAVCRASNRFATFAHATASNKPTAPNSTYIELFTWYTMESRSGSKFTVQCRSNSGFSRSICRAIPTISRCAASTDMPAFTESPE